MGQCGCGRDILISLLGHVYVSKLSCGESEKKKNIYIQILSDFYFDA